MYEHKYTCVMLERILRLMGISVNPAHRKYEKYRILVYFVVAFPLVIAGELYASVLLESFVYKMDAILYFACTVLFANMIAVVYRQRLKLLLVYKRIVDNEEFVGETFFDVCDPRLKATLAAFRIRISLGLCVWAVVPISIGCLSGIELGSLPTVFYSALFPWRVDPRLGYAFTLCMQAALGFFPLTVFLGTFSFIMYIQVLISSLASILEWRVDNIDVLTRRFRCDSDQQHLPTKFQRESEPDIATLERKLDRRIRRNLREIFRHHQFMTRITKDCIRLMTPYINTSILVCFACSILMSSTMILVDGNYMYRLKMVSAMILGWYYLSIGSEVGNFLNEVNDQLVTRLYGTEWYRQSIQIRKEMLRFMIICQNPFKIQVFGISVVNYAYLTTILRNSYSVISVILKTNNKTA